MTQADARPLEPAGVADAGGGTGEARMEALEMAALHATGFPPRARWSPAAITASLAARGAFDVQAHGAFAIGRVAAGEAELHTLVVAPFLRRTGAATRLLAAFDAEARARGASAAFLEVAEGNDAARALYARTGWAPVGRRRGYYGGADAVVLRKVL